MKIFFRSSVARVLLHSSTKRSFSAETGQSPIRWGILSAGKIASDYTKAIHVAEGAEPFAVAARSENKAEAFAKEHDIPHFYGSYEDLLANPDIDAVYVGSVADQHFKLATQALLAGKPTIVEKPLTLSYDKTMQLVNVAKQQDTFLMEGMWTRCFPAMRKVRDMIAAGEIGDVVTIQGDFGWSTKDCGPDDRIWFPESGGMVLDIGMYMAQLGQVAFPQTPVERIQAMGTKKNGVDHTVLANVKYDGGMLQFYVTGEANTEERVVIQGTTGRIVLEPPAHVPTRIRLQTDAGRNAAGETLLEYPLPDDSYTTWNYPGSIGFVHQIEAVGEALRHGERECRHYTLHDSLQVASILDNILMQVHAPTSETEEALSYS